MTRRFVPLKLDNYRPLRDIVFEHLREAIIAGVLKPGERLMEIQLAEELGVSRTPVREAIRKLELEGFVVMVPRKGAYVAGVSVKDITDVFELRAALEALAAGLAAERITEEETEEMERRLNRYAAVTEDADLNLMVEADIDFHDCVYRASRNQRLVQITNNLREQLRRFRTTSLSDPGRRMEAVDEHRKLVEAIEARNVQLAQSLAWEHIENAENSMLEAMGAVKKKSPS
ncbi:GntR family transcriptional regulator [Heliophilum fasciatum]|uniref:GntR family transcriptional regulator n=1 Tax=Heliophilum fasciatum TaxID=35700 RepID=A0A4R2S7T0_9FIRM|nr:GntR family transcriptional regulator [Heliophilum fasciatum]MCW2277013.1 DNA-binding GntR family transcriptional regulator [Heliophilum fasciatum]TCP68461.1 GntR family transcriptional regulator [Heliophilum fasciatum]